MSANNKRKKPTETASAKASGSKAPAAAAAAAAVAKRKVTEDDEDVQELVEPAVSQEKDIEAETPAAEPDAEQDDETEAKKRQKTAAADDAVAEDIDLSQAPPDPYPPLPAVSSKPVPPPPATKPPLVLKPATPSASPKPPAPAPAPAAAAAAASKPQVPGAPDVRSGSVSRPVSQFAAKPVTSQFSTPAAPAAYAAGRSSSTFRRPAAAAAAGAGAAGDAGGDGPVNEFGEDGDIDDLDKYADANNAFKSDPNWYENFLRNPALIANRMRTWSEGTGKKREQKSAFSIVDTREDGNQKVKIRSPVMRVRIWENVPFGNYDMKIKGGQPSKFPAVNIFAAKARYGLGFRAYSKNDEDGCDPHVVAFARLASQISEKYVGDAIKVHPDYGSWFNTFVAPGLQMMGTTLDKLSEEKRAEQVANFFKTKCSHPFRMGQEGDKTTFFKDSKANKDYNGATSFHVTSRYKERVERKSNTMAMIDILKKGAADKTGPGSVQTQEEFERDVDAKLDEDIMKDVGKMIDEQVKKHNDVVKKTGAPARPDTYPVAPRIYAMTTDAKGVASWERLSYAKLVQLEASNDFLASFVFHMAPANPTPKPEPGKPATAPGVLLEMESMWIVAQNIGKKGGGGGYVPQVPSCAAPFVPAVSVVGISKQLQKSSEAIGKHEYKLMIT